MMPPKSPDEPVKGHIGCSCVVELTLCPYLVIPMGAVCFTNHNNYKNCEEVTLCIN
jgi:hypothetical protein